MKIIGIEHVGIAVDDLEETSSFWGDILRIAHTHTEKVESECVNTKIFDTGKGKIELLDSLEEYSPIRKFLHKRGPGIHHICLEVEDINIAIKELKELLKDVDHIYFAGGEPLIMKKHYEILDFLIENNLNEKVFLRYNTNLSTLKYKNINIIEKWKLFPKLSILPSADLNGERGAYQRWGFDWDKFKNNWLEIKNAIPHTNLGMQITISSLTIGYLPEFLSELKKIGCNNMNSNFVHGPADLNPQVLPIKLKKIYTNKLNRYISKTSSDVHKKLLHEAINFMNDTDNTDKKMWERTLHRLDFLDKKRKTNWKSLWPEFVK